MVVAGQARGVLLRDAPRQKPRAFAPRPVTVTFPQLTYPSTHLQPLITNF